MKLTKGTVWFIALLIGLSTMEVGGNVTANITFNYWMRDFPYGSQTITVNYICAIFYVLLFLPMALVTIIRDVRKYGASRVRKLIKPRHVVNGLLIALADTWINIAQTYSAGRSTVVTQMFAKSTEPIVTFLLSKLVLRDSRTFLSSPAPLISFACIIAAVVLHLYSSLSKHNDHATAFYIVLYYTSVIGSSFYAIAQGRFMRQAHEEYVASTAIARPDEGYNHVSQDGDDDRIALNSGSAALDPSVPSDEPPPSAVIRSLALALDCTFTLLITLVVVPFLDIIPHFGYSSSLSEVWGNFSSGCHCLLHCEHNLAFAVVTCGAWALVYFADTFMNHFSPTLNSVINEFTAPVGVLVLYVYPPWALGSPPAADAGTVARDVASALLLVVGASLFARYEMMGSQHQSAIADRKEKAIAAGRLELDAASDADGETLKGDVA